MKATKTLETQALQGTTFKHNGEGGIRTLGTIAGTLVFETNAFDHSATSPGCFNSHFTLSHSFEATPMSITYSTTDSLIE